MSAAFLPGVEEDVSLLERENPELRLPTYPALQQTGGHIVLVTFPNTSHLCNEYRVIENPRGAD